MFIEKADMKRMETLLASSSSHLNPIQISLLRLFDRGLTDEQILELRRVLVRHYSVMLRQEVERVVNEKGYTANDFDAMLNCPS